MKSKKQFKVRPLNKKDLKVGDKVYLIDGSSLTIGDEDDKEDYYIVFAYPNVTKREKILREIEATVLETELTDFFAEGVFGGIYQQDIKILVGKAIFYTSSAHVILSQ